MSARQPRRGRPTVLDINSSSTILGELHVPPRSDAEQQQRATATFRHVERTAARIHRGDEYAASLYAVTVLEALGVVAVEPETPPATCRCGSELTLHEISVSTRMCQRCLRRARRAARRTAQAGDAA